MLKLFFKYWYFLSPLYLRTDPRLKCYSFNALFGSCTNNLIYFKGKIATQLNMQRNVNVQISGNFEITDIIPPLPILA